MIWKKQGQFRLATGKKLFTKVVVKHLVCPERLWRGPIPGNFNGQVGWKSKLPDLVEDVSANCPDNI